MSLQPSPQYPDQPHIIPTCMHEPQNHCLNNDIFTLALRHKRRLPIHPPKKCPNCWCGTIHDCYGDDAFTCVCNHKGVAHNIIKRGSITILKHLPISAKLLPPASTVTEEKKKLIPTCPGLQPLDVSFSPNPTLPHRTPHFPTLPHRTPPYHTVPHRTTPYHTVPHRTTPYPTVPHRTQPYPTIPNHTPPYPTIPQCPYTNIGADCTITGPQVPLIFSYRCTISSHGHCQVTSIEEGTR